jgi:hypothetical protein
VPDHNSNGPRGNANPPPGADGPAVLVTGLYDVPPEERRRCASAVSGQGKSTPVLAVLMKVYDCLAAGGAVEVIDPKA